jgi:hypothetical protein
MKSKFALLTLALLAVAGVVLGAEPAEVPPPPWLMTNTHGIEVGYPLDEAVVRRILPKGIEPVKEITGGFEIYVSPAGYGIAPYSAFNFFVDVEGLDMPDGRKGRWMLQGFYGPAEPVASAIRHHYGWPVKAGGARVQNSGKDMVWTGAVNGKDYIEVKMRRKSADCEVHSAMDYWSGRSDQGAVLINPIPNTYCWREVELVSIKFLAPAGETMSALKPDGKQIAYAVEWENGAWSFTRPTWKP